jgi:hypothetical protein
MHVDRGAFLMFLTSLGLGGAAGYVASEKDLVPHLDGKPSRGAPPPAPPPPIPAPSATPVVASAPPTVDASPPPVDAGAACDDGVGEADPCPPIGFPTAEGGCGAFTHVRCNDFKQTMKPRVAKAAVACLNKLTPAERCDPRRVDLCAHLALMNACEEAAPAIVSACDAVGEACAKAPVPPSRSECRRAMSGLREIGREAMVACVKKHCFDRGIVGCEAAAPGRPP